MNRRRWGIRGVLAALAWIGLGLGQAQGAGVYPTNQGTLMLDPNGTVTVSIYQDDRLLPAALTLSSPSRCTTTGTAYFRDITDCWLPEWNPTTGATSTYVVVNGSGSSPTLVPPVTPLAPGAGTNPFLTNLTTSAYPGKCTNIGSSTDADYNDPDFTLDPTPVQLATPTGPIMGYKLTTTDCGGMAVIQVDNAKFILPRDGTATVPANGIPDKWESLYVKDPAILDPAGDGDTGPGANTLTGDGLATFDEYRGFIVSGKQIRTDPWQKDLFVHLVNSSAASLLLASGYPTPTNPTATLTLPGAAKRPDGVGKVFTFTANAAVFSNANTLGEIIGTAGGRARIVAVADSTTVTAQITGTDYFSATSLASGSWQLSESVFGTAYGMYATERLRLLGYTPGATNFTTTEWADNFQGYSELGGIQYNAAGPASDRVVNVNRVYGLAQKGVRVIESVDAGSTSPYGWTFGGTGSPNTTGNVVIYTKRIVNQIISLINKGAGRLVRYSPMGLYSSRSWTPMTDLGAPTDPAVRNFIISKALQFYVAHELGHTFRLNVTTTTPPHFAPGTGDDLDQAITTKLDTKTTGYNTFYIPSLYGLSDQKEVLLK